MAPGAGYNEVAEKRVDFQYDIAGQFYAITRYKAVAGTTSNDVAQTIFSFDRMGRLEELRQWDMETADVPDTIVDYEFAFDPASRITQMISSVDGTTDYQYDETDQLTQEDGPGSPINYDYDENGNRVTGYTPGDFNRVLASPTHTFTYDYEGNQTSRTNKDTGVREAMSWDYRNRLTSIETLTPREIAHWRFDGDTTDSTANNLSGTLQGDATFNGGGTNVASGSGGSLETFGTSDYVSMGDQNLLKLRDHDFSISLWFNPDTEITSKLVGQGNVNNGGGKGYDIIYWGGAAQRKIQFRVNDGVTEGSYDAQVLTYNTTGLQGGWHQVAVTIDRDGYITLYLDGVQRDQQVFDQNKAVDDDIIGTSAFVSGGYSSGIQSFDGRIDDLRVWHEPLDTDDIAAIYASTESLFETTKVVEYDYDAFDRRIRKQIDINGDTDFDETQEYVYDGQDIVLALDDSGTLTNRYLHGPAVDMILADEQYGATDHDDPETDEGVVYWPLTDHLGSVRDLVDNDGDVAKHIEYDGFGQMTADHPEIKHIYGFTGREHDAESHLQYNRARYYDTAIGSWLSEDPIGFAGRDENLRRYVGNQTISQRDPSGLINSWQQQALDELDKMQDAIGQLPGVAQEVAWERIIEARKVITYANDELSTLYVRSLVQDWFEFYDIKVDIYCSDNVFKGRLERPFTGGGNGFFEWDGHRNYDGGFETGDSFLRGRYRGGAWSVGGGTHRTSPNGVQGEIGIYADSDGSTSAEASASGTLQQFLPGNNIPIIDPNETRIRVEVRINKRGEIVTYFGVEVPFGGRKFPFSGGSTSSLWE